MPDAWVYSLAFTLLLCLQSSLQRVNANQVLSTCEFLNCPKGFRCCDNDCCLEKTVWDPSSDPLRILFIIFLVMVPLLCICGLVWRFCRKCREPEQDLRRDRHIPPGPPSSASLERIWVTSLDPPPPYSQVVLKPTPTEPPPPYSLRPEEPADHQMRGTDNPAF